MSTRTLTSLQKPLQRISLPSILTRFEGLVLFGAALISYGTQGFGWWLFALLLLLPDIAALGYLIDRRVGNLSYNLAHTITFPLCLAVVAALTQHTLGLQLALIWLAHIGMDRSVGYGFKDATGSK